VITNVYFSIRDAGPRRTPPPRLWRGGGAGRVGIRVLQPGAVVLQVFAALSVMAAYAVATPIFVDGGHRGQVSESSESYVSSKPLNMPARPVPVERVHGKLT